MSSLARGRALVPLERSRLPSVSSRRAHSCRSFRNDAPQSKTTTLEDHYGSAKDGTVVADANQEQIAQAAALVLARAKAVLDEKLEEYNSELEELENAASRNILYRATNAWTIRLLRRKSEFVKARIRAMDELAANVYSCSLDRKCTFMLKTSADLEEMKRVVSSTLDETLSGGFTAQQTAAKAFTDPQKLKTYDQQVEKDLGISLPPVTWNADDEARVLEDALWEAAQVASKIEGASVQVERSYDCVDRCERRDVKQEADLTFEVSSFMNDKLGMNLERDVIKAASEPTAASVSVDTALTGIFNVFGASVTASFLMWIFGLTPSLDDTLHWNAMLPLEFSKAQTLVLWTAPLATAYAVLGVLRGYQNEHSPSGAIGSVTQASAFAADRLQAAGRKLQYVSASSASDMRIQYFLSTLESVCVGAPFFWGLLPGVVLKLGAPFGGFVFKGATVPRLIQVPFIALGVAAVCGMGNFFNSAASDMMTRDERRDDTKYVDSLFQVQNVGGVPGVPKTTIENGRLELSSELGSDNVTAARVLDQYASEMGAPAQLRAGEVISEVSKNPPTSITMDFLSAASKRDFNSQQEWIQPTAVMLSSFYLCLEAQITGEIAYAAFTQIVGILVLDYMTRPWNRVSMAVRIVMDQGTSGRSLNVQSNQEATDSRNQQP